MGFTRRFILLGAIGTFLSACASKFKTYNGPQVTKIQVTKSDRRMHLFSGEKVLKSYNFQLGFAPEGHKQIEGDGRTPEGGYRISYKNPDSRFHLSLKINYPNANDRAKAHSMGKSPGGDIFIHGTPSLYAGEADWTWGCIAVTDQEMEDIYSMVNVGTVIYIYP